MLAEYSDFCDTVQFSFLDHYMNITLKSVHILKYVLDHPILSQSLEHVLVIDDDTFVNVPALYEEVYIIKVCMQKMEGFARRWLSSLFLNEHFFSAKSKINTALPYFTSSSRIRVVYIVYIMECTSEKPISLLKI